MASFIKSSDSEFGLQLENFRSKLPGYATALGVTVEEIDTVNADTNYYLSVLLAQTNFQTYAESVTNYKDLLRYGNGNEVLGQFPKVPKAPVNGGGDPTVASASPAPMVAANVQERFSKLVQRIKGSPNYNKTIGEDLGIEGTETPFNPETGKPEIKTTYSSGGHPVLKWKKGKFQGLEVWKNTGTGWTKLDTDTCPDYTDKTELPPVGQTAVWKYKMIYLYKDAQVGQWSDEATVTVSGSI